MIPRLAAYICCIYRTPGYFAAGMAIFAFALVAAAALLEDALGVRACELCHRQRYIWLAVGVVSLAAVVGHRHFRRVRWGALPTVAVLCGFGAYTAFYQLGLEQGWWLGSCAADFAADNVADLKRMLAEAPIVSCAEASWHFLGLSFAGWNVIISSAAALKTVLAIAVAKPSR